MQAHLERFWHHTLRVPFRLHVHERRKVKKPGVTLVFLHGLGGSGAAWREVVEAVGHHQVDVLVLDMLGFGKSPKPGFAAHDAISQARAVNATLAGRVRSKHIILIGHSMGALVAIECARRSAKRYSALVLASPPLYDERRSTRLTQRDARLKQLYAAALERPEQLIKLGSLAKKYGLVGSAFDVSRDSVAHYSEALSAAIINQTSYQDIFELDVPVFLTYGTLDPFVIGARFREIKKAKPNVHVRRFIGGHDIEGRYAGIIANTISRAIDEIEPRSVVH